MKDPDQTSVNLFYLWALLLPVGSILWGLFMAQQKHQRIKRETYKAIGQGFDDYYREQEGEYDKKY